MTTLLVRARTTDRGRPALIEVKDLGAQAGGNLALRCRMMLEGDDESVSELVSLTAFLDEKRRLGAALQDLGDNGVLVQTAEVIDSSGRGFAAVMKAAAMLKLGLTV